MPAARPAAAEAHIAVTDLAIGYGSFVLMRDVDFAIRRGDVFAIMGGSGCGKTTLLRAMVGLKAPAAGDVLYDGESFWDADPAERRRLTRRFGVLYQQGALWSSMTLAENVALPLGEHSGLGAAEIRDLVALQARAGRPRGLRRLLSRRDQRRHAQARRRSPARSRSTRRCCSSTSPRPGSTRSARAASTT